MIKSGLSQEFKANSHAKMVTDFTLSKMCTISHKKRLTTLTNNKM